MLKTGNFVAYLTITLQLFILPQHIFAKQNIEDGDLLLHYEEIQAYDYSLGSYSDYKVTTPPQVVKLNNGDLYKNIDEIKNALLEKQRLALIYDDDAKEIVVVDTTLIRGEANLNTTLGGGWEHKVGVGASDFEVNTGLRKMISQNTLLKFEDVFKVDGNLGGLVPGNKVTCSVNINF